MKNRILILLLFLSYNGFSQFVNHNTQVSTGYNRVGFYNEWSYKLGLKNHYLKFGARHYTFDNFFEKNTIGFSFDYTKRIDSKKEKVYFYPGVSLSLFTEDKTNAKLSLKDYKIISGIGFNIVKKLSVYYQIGFGILDATSNLKMVNEIVKINYFNYEMVFGLSYRFGNSTK
jgi:hypothetical protein